FVDASPQTIDGDPASPGTILLGGYSPDGLVASTSSVKLTIGPNLTITGAAGRIDTGTVPFDNQGAIIADPTATGPNPFQTLVILNGTNWTNHGTIQAQNGGLVKAQGTVANFSGGTLTDGNWNVFANSTLRLLGGNITTNAAGITLSGANSNFYNSDAGTT